MKSAMYPHRHQRQVFHEKATRVYVCDKIHIVLPCVVERGYVRTAHSSYGIRPVDSPIGDKAAVPRFLVAVIPPIRDQLLLLLLLFSH